MMSLLFINKHPSLKPDARFSRPGEAVIQIKTEADSSPKLSSNSTRGNDDKCGEEGLAQ